MKHQNNENQWKKHFTSINKTLIKQQLEACAQFMVQLLEELFRTEKPTPCSSFPMGVTLSLIHLLFIANFMHMKLNANEFPWKLLWLFFLSFVRSSFPFISINVKFTMENDILASNRLYCLTAKACVIRVIYTNEMKTI